MDSQVILNLQLRHNFEWRWYCTENGLTRKDLHKIFDKTEQMIIMADLIMVLTFFQILICQCFLNFLTFTPFCKAYCLKDNIYKKSLYRQIREGEHPCYVGIKKITQTIINFAQLFMIFNMFYSVNGSGSKMIGDDDVLNKLRRMIVIGCSDDYMN